MRIDVVTTSYAAAYSILRVVGGIAVAHAAEAGGAVVIPYSLREGARCRGSGHCLTVIRGEVGDLLDPGPDEPTGGSARPGPPGRRLLRSHRRSSCGRGVTLAAALHLTLCTLGTSDGRTLPSAESGAGVVEVRVTLALSFCCRAQLCGSRWRCRPGGDFSSGQGRGVAQRLSRLACRRAPLAWLEALRFARPGPLGVRSVTWAAACWSSPAWAAPCAPG